MSDTTELIMLVLVIILMIATLGSMIWIVGEQALVKNPRNEAFCLEQGFSDWDFAVKATGVRNSIVCSDKGRLAYFIYEDNKYFEVIE